MIYFDNAATTFPKPQRMGNEIIRCISKYCGNPGRSSHKMSVKSAEKIYETREIIAKLFNAEAERVVFTYNTTYALNIAIKSLIKYSSHILISDIEHNAVLRPISALAQERLCSFDVFCTSGTDEEILSSIREKIKSNTSMIVCSHVSNIGVRTLPIKKIGELCKSMGIKLIIDGAQSAGVHHINVKEMNIDALCVPSHKGLYGPQGIGIIIFGDSEVGRTFIEGGTGINSKETNMPDFLPERYEAGTMSTPLIAGLCESLKWLEEIGIDRIRHHEESLYFYLLSKLEDNRNIIVYKMNDYPGNTLLFNVNSFSPTNVSEELNKRGICVRAGYHCSPLAHSSLGTKEGGVRVSFSVFNTRNEVNIFYDELCNIINA